MTTFKSLFMESNLIVEGTGVPLNAKILKTYNLEEYIKNVLGEDFIRKSKGINSPVEWLAFTH